MAQKTDPLAARVHALIAQPSSDGSVLCPSCGRSELDIEVNGHCDDCTMLTDAEYGALDPGIREVVRFLNVHGFITTDSGDGQSKPPDWYASGCALPCRNVACPVEPTQLLMEADRLAALLGKGWHIEATYFPADHHAVLLATEGDPAEQYAKQVAVSKPTCAACEYLTPFELADDIFTCPTVNIRIHRESIHTFGCNFFEPKAALEAALAAAETETLRYPCGCSATGLASVPRTCPEHPVDSDWLGNLTRALAVYDATSFHSAACDELATAARNLATGGKREEPESEK